MNLQTCLVCDAVKEMFCCVQALHVINYEFPGFISDYIHRIGRVGRVGSPGVCFAVSFVTYKSDVDLLWKIEVVLLIAVLIIADYYTPDRREGGNKHCFCPSVCPSCASSVSDTIPSGGRSEFRGYVPSQLRGPIFEKS